MVDKNTMANHFARAAASYAGEAEAQCRIIDRMVGIMRENGFERGNTIYEAGCGVGLLTRRLIEGFAPAEMMVNDICHEMAPFVESLAPEVRFIRGDAETTDIPAGTTAVVSCSAMQWFRDIPMFIRRVRQSIPAGGIFAFSTFGPRNFSEIRSLTGQGLAYHSHEEYLGFLKDAGFSVKYSEEELIRLDFTDVLDILRHLRNTGVGGIGAARMTPAQTVQFRRDYSAGFADASGRIPLTYHPLYFYCHQTDKTE